MKISIARILCIPIAWGIKTYYFTRRIRIALEIHRNVKNHLRERSEAWNKEGADPKITRSIGRHYLRKMDRYLLRMIFLKTVKSECSGCNGIEKKSSVQY